MAAGGGKGEHPPVQLLHRTAGDGPELFMEKGLDRLFGQRMLGNAGNLAEVAADTYVFKCVYTFHPGSSLNT
jgi:hypothetical protein